MNIGQALLLGILQGLTEFLPVSSSGHLVLGRILLGIPENGIAFEIFVHFGTLLAVLVAFRKDVWQMIKSVLAAFKYIVSPAKLAEQYHRDSELRLALYIIIGTIPAFIIGLLFKDSIENAFNDPHLVSLMLIVTAAILFSTLFIKKTDKDLTLSKSVIIGLAQSLAILPGISRSGSTISFGMFLKVDGNRAARFSFLLAIPAILGATVLKISDLISAGIDSNYMLVLAVGTIAAFISGYISILFLLDIVRRGKLYWFAPYCLIIGIMGLLFI